MYKLKSIVVVFNYLYDIKHWKQAPDVNINFSQNKNIGKIILRLSLSFLESSFNLHLLPYICDKRLKG